MPSTKEIDGAILSLGGDGGRFTARDIREALAIASDDRAGATPVYNRLQGLLNRGVLRSHGRAKRHRPYSLVPSRARELHGQPAERAVTGAPDVAIAELAARLARVESLVLDIHTALFSDSENEEGEP